MVFIKKNSDFVKDSITVLTGTSLSQIIPLIFYPLLTRIYSPEEFGFMAFFMSVCAVMIVLASGAYEQAILITKNSVELDNLIKLTLTRSLIMLVVISLILIALISTVPILYTYKIYLNWVLLLSLAAFFTIIYNLYNEWCVKKAEFKKLSVNKVYNSIFTSLFKSINKLFSFISNGLIFGELIGKFIISIISVKSMLINGTDIFRGYSIETLKKTRVKFQDYPKYMMFDLLINTIGGSVHVYIILAFFDANELGYLSLSLSLLTLPVTVISGGIKDVFRQKANKLYINEGSCRNLYVQLLRPIAITGFVGFSLLYFITPFIFPYVLGDKWLKSGLYAQYLIPLFYFNFVSMSLGGIFVIANKIKISLYWQVFNTTITVSALLIGSALYNSISMTIILFSIAKSISYLIYMIISYIYSTNRNHENI